MRLQQLDERHLPAAASWLRARVDRAEALRERSRTTVSRWSLAALDARYGDKPPFRLLLAQPVLALVVAAALLAAGVGVAVVREPGNGRTSGRHSRGELSGQGDTPKGSVLGPQVGDRTGDYVRQATNQLVDAVRADPTGTRVALVSFSAYRTPAQADALVAGFTVTRAFLRAKAAGKQAAALPIEIHGALLPALQTAYAETARTRAAAQKSYQGYVNTLRPRSTQDRAFRDLYSAFAKSSGIEAREFAHDCACVYAVLVTAKPVLLLSLNARPGVRAVEVAGAGLSGLQVQVNPLLPEVDGIVPRPSFGGLS